MHRVVTDVPHSGLEKAEKECEDICVFCWNARLLDGEVQVEAFLSQRHLLKQQLSINDTGTENMNSFSTYKV